MNVLMIMKCCNVLLCFDEQKLVYIAVNDSDNDTELFLLTESGHN